MKKLLIALLFVLILIPAKAQSVEEEIKFYGHSMTMGSQTASIAGDYQVVQFLSNGNITCVPGNYRVEMTPYNGRTDIFGDQIPYNTNNLRYRCDKLPAIEVVIHKDKNVMIVCSNITYPISSKSIAIYSTTPPNGSSPSPSPGINPTPSPSPTPKVDHGRTCAGCRGTGVCAMCKGKGGYYTNSGYYTGSGSKTWHTCSSCGGSGRCGVCYGKGVIE